MKKKWKFMYALDDCDKLDIDKACTGDDLQFLPHVGDILFPSDFGYYGLDTIAKECWRENHCKDCPYLYGKGESEDDIDVSDAKYVSSIIHEAEDKRILIFLSKEEP